jgi:hypothetical protein
MVIFVVEERVILFMRLLRFSVDLESHENRFFLTKISQTLFYNESSS